MLVGIVSSVYGAAPTSLPTMAIFIHGTILPILTVPVLGRVFSLMRERHLSFTAAQDEILRYHTMCRNQPIGPQGLHSFDLPQRTYPWIPATNNAYAQAFKAVWQQTYSEDTSTLHFYTFGWNGKLSHKHRLRAAGNLYDDVIAQRAALALRYGCDPSQVAIMIFCHSHGASVALLLAEHHKREKKDLFIKRLTLVGAPVQEEIQKYACAPLFASVVHLYSKADAVQTLDVFSSKSSKRRFSCRHRLAHVTHVEMVVEREEDPDRTWGPTHLHLWCFNADQLGLNPIIRRLPTNPLPLSLFIPPILKIEDKLRGQDLLARIVCCKDGSFNVVTQEKEEDATTDTVKVPGDLFTAAAHTFKRRSTDFS